MILQSSVQQRLQKIEEQQRTSLLTSTEKKQISSTSTAKSSREIQGLCSYLKATSATEMVDASFIKTLEADDSAGKRALIATFDKSIHKQLYGVLEKEIISLKKHVQDMFKKLCNGNTTPKILAFSWLKTHKNWVDYESHDELEFITRFITECYYQHSEPRVRCLV
jgi:hypothetical protein